MIAMFKMINGIDKVNVHDLFTVEQEARTKGHNFKIWIMYIYHLYLHVYWGVPKYYKLVTRVSQMWSREFGF